VDEGKGVSDACPAHRAGVHPIDLRLMKFVEFLKQAFAARASAMISSRRLMSMQRLTRYEASKTVSRRSSL
jgi:hypothetical protein